MIDYETFCKIHDCHDRQGLTIAQTARALGLHPQTVATWLARSRFEPRRGRPRGSVLDPFKPRITRLLDTHPYSAQQILQRLREEGYGGGMTILRDCVRRIRPPQRPVYLKLHFAPGECAQVDWGAYGTVAVDNTRRRLSFFVLVLAFSRQMFVEFTVSQTMEHFLACHEHAFAALGGVPSKIMVDNLKSAVLQRLAGAAPVFNPRYSIGRLAMSMSARGDGGAVRGRVFRQVAHQPPAARGPGSPVADVRFMAHRGCALDSWSRESRWECSTRTAMLAKS